MTGEGGVGGRIVVLGFVFRGDNAGVGRWGWCSGEIMHVVFRGDNAVWNWAKSSLLPSSWMCKWGVSNLAWFVAPVELCPVILILNHSFFFFFFFLLHSDREKGGKWQLWKRKPKYYLVFFAVRLKSVEMTHTKIRRESVQKGTTPVHSLFYVQYSDPLCTTSIWLSRLIGAKNQLSVCPPWKLGENNLPLSWSWKSVKTE